MNLPNPCREATTLLKDLGAKICLPDALSHDDPRAEDIIRKIRRDITQIGDLLRLLSGGLFDSPIAMQSTDTVHGKAISPYTAALCFDVQKNRTICFIRGLYQAVRAQQRKFPGQRIKILYAGTGPFAALVLPLTSLFKPQEIGITVLDIHESSVQNVRLLLEQLDLMDFFDAFICADAATYKVCGETHIAIAECMDQVLSREPQVAITRNLVPQLTDGGLWIPEEIKVGLMIVPDRAEPPIILDPNVYRVTQALPQGSRPCIQVSRTIADRDWPTCRSQLALGMNIVTYGKETLGPRDSSLTDPIWFYWGSRPPHAVGIDYKPGDLMRNIQVSIQMHPSSDTLICTLLRARQQVDYLASLS